jgi:hypothetical protein
MAFHFIIGVMSVKGSVAEVEKGCAPPSSNLGRQHIGALLPMDRANAIRLLKALVTAGANSNTLMVKAWVHDIAVRNGSLRSAELSSALAYAEGQGWIADGPRQGWTTITRAGESAARLRII